jgi:hypothetical protein
LTILKVSAYSNLKFLVRLGMISGEKDRNMIGGKPRKMINLSARVQTNPLGRGKRPVKSNQNSPITRTIITTPSVSRAKKAKVNQSML